MLVYTQIAGESAPEAYLLSGPDATIGDLVAKVARSRAAAGRRLLAPLAGDDDASQLRHLGITEGDLIVLVADGAPVYELARPSGTQAILAASPTVRLSGVRLNEYEELTQLLQWHAPYHIDADRPSHQVWSEESTELRCSNWDAYRSPDKLYYRTYVNGQAKAERAVRTAFEIAEEGAQLQSVAPDRVERLRGILPALRYPDWGLCMLHQHATRFALSSWVAGATDFMMFDELRHAQLYGRLALAYEEAHGGFDDAGDLWMSGVGLQPARRLIEELVTVLDWGTATLVAGLIVEPHLTATVHAILESGSLQAGDGLTPFVCASIRHDKLRHRDGAVALTELLCHDGRFGAGNRRVVQTLCADWLPRSRAAAQGLAAGDARVLAAVDAASEQLIGIGRDVGIDVGVGNQAELVAP